MRFLMRSTIPVASGNSFVSDKEMNQKMEALMSAVKPDSVYFGIEKGQRTIFCLVNVEGGHELPRMAEPFWLALKADVEFVPLMNQEDFKKASPDIEKSVQRFNWK